MKVAPIPPPRPKKFTQTIIVNVAEKDETNKIVPAPDVKIKSIVEVEVKKPANSSPKENTTPTIAEVFTGSKTKTLTMKKKSSLMSKRRKVSLKSLSNSLEIQGFLYRRTKDRTGVTYWAKYYFVLMDTSLYGFKRKESKKADCLIFLSGFTVSLAKEVHSKQYAFKVYHPSKTFYFASETYEALLQWTEYIKQAIMKAAPISNVLETDPKHLFSETDLSDDENDPQNDSSMLMDSMKELDGSGNSHRLNFGSLRKFAKPSNNVNAESPDNKFLGFFTSHKSQEKRILNDLPIPTSQFKSYRKVQSNISSCANVVSSFEKINQISNQGKSEIFSKNTENFRDFEINQSINASSLTMNEDEECNGKMKNYKKSPHNYIHASNPNLVDFEFHYAKTNDFSIPKLSSSSNHNNWDAYSHSSNHFLTLKDLMLQKQEEEARDMYDKQVFMGFEKNCDIEKAAQRKNSKATEKIVEKSVKASNNDPLIQKIQERELPITPDYAQSFKPDDHNILYTRSKEGQKLRDFGYEMILGEDSQEHQDLRKSTDKNWYCKRTDKIVPSYGDSLRKKSLNWICSNEESRELQASISSDSQKKIKKRLDITKLSNTSNKKMPLKSGNKSMEIVEPPKKSSSMNYFSKISNSKSNKEKKLLGSPRLHRAIFGKSLQSTSSSNSNACHEFFFPRVTSDF